MARLNREKFKQDLISNGIEWSDQQINSYINARLSSTNNGSYLNETVLSEDLFNVIEHWEDGDRSRKHNNPGAHIWSPQREEKYGAQKGDPFVDSEGITRHTAKYDTIEQGE